MVGNKGSTFLMSSEILRDNKLLIISLRCSMTTLFFRATVHLEVKSSVVGLAVRRFPNDLTILRYDFFL